MKQFATIALALLTVAPGAFAQPKVADVSASTEFLSGAQVINQSENAIKLAESGCFDISAQENNKLDAPAPLGGTFSDWEMIGKARFNAELGIVEPCDVNVWYCTTDPSGMGMGVDSYYLEGVFVNGLRIASMPFIDYTNIGNANTGVTSDGKEVMIDELSNHYGIGIESTIEDLCVGIIKIASLYYVDDPDVVDNVIAYGYETIQLEGDFKDYRVNFEIAGECRTAAKLKTNVSFADAENVKVQCYPGKLNYPQKIQKANAQHADETIPTIAESGSQYLDLTEDGVYTVIMTYDKGDEGWEYLTDTYEYDSRWEDYGTADFTDDYLASYYNDFPIATASGIKVQRHTVNTGHYRLVNPYSTTDTWQKIWSKLKVAEPECNSFFVINAEDPEKVYIYINPVDITYDDGIRMVCGSAAHYNIINDRGDDVITEKGYWGSFTTDGDVSTVLFPERTLMMRPINSEYPLFANNNNGFKVVINKGTSGIDNAIIDSADSVVTGVYNLSGVEINVDNAKSGIYLVKYSDGTVKKVVK